MPDATLRIDAMQTEMVRQDQERTALLALADAVDAWLLHPTAKARAAMGAARDAVARVRAAR